jgi:Nicotinate phosphoribosyltransferase (NAPRTase) N-terminal domain
VRAIWTYEASEYLPEPRDDLDGTSPDMLLAHANRPLRSAMEAKVLYLPGPVGTFRLAREPSQPWCSPCRVAKGWRYVPNPSGGLPVMDRRATTVTELYKVTMALTYLHEGMIAPATFSLFTRKLPTSGGFLVAAGPADVLDFLECFYVEEADLVVFAAALDCPAPTWLGCGSAVYR